MLSIAKHSSTILLRTSIQLYWIAGLSAFDLVTSLCSQWESVFADTPTIIGIIPVLLIC